MVALLSCASCAHAPPALEPEAAPSQLVAAPSASVFVATRPAAAASTTPPVQVPIVLAPVDTNWWLAGTHADDAGNTTALYVDAARNLYSLIRPVGVFTLPGRNEISAERIEDDMRLGATHLRVEDGTITASTDFQFLDMSCRYVAPCSLECVEGRREQRTARYRIAGDGSVVAEATSGTRIVSGQTGWAFSPPHTSEAQCQSRMLVLAAILYQSDDASHDGDAGAF
ncbi:MAG: hypothetical protein IPK60_14795 [Sandaracinaceae bacterium]|nr:hypothetical protein [Sandaracinaceae bacterium]